MTGGEPHAITSLARSVSTIAWSPRGETIAFTTETNPDEAGEKKKDDEYESDVVGRVRRHQRGEQSTQQFGLA